MSLHGGRVRSVLGLDIGGANLKAFHSAGDTRLKRFELWKNPAGLPRALIELLASMPKADLLAVTMTGELCDCFETKRQGVTSILDAVEQAAGPVPVSIWQTDGHFVTIAAAREQPLPAAAANWLALASFAGRYVPHGTAVLIDIGSTTTDLVPLLNGQPVPRGRTDPERMENRELVYTGVRRTPVMALLGSEVAAEFFASTHDVYLVLGKHSEDAGDRDTADGRPATRVGAKARLSRMFCADLETCSEERILDLARKAREQQTEIIRQALDYVVASLPSMPQNIVLAGSGEFLARDLLERHEAWAAFAIHSLSEKLGQGVSDVACAYAVAVLAQEQGDEQP